MNLTPIARGSAFAIAAAVLFGVTTPLVRHFGDAVGPFATVTLLYTGAACASGFRRRAPDEPALRRDQLRRIALVALFGAVLAPASLAWGLQHAGALAASLLLNLEAVFTALLARALYREPIGGRVAVAVGLMVAGGAVLAVRGGEGGASSALGLVAITGASLGWALDNTLTRPLADFDPRAVVVGKAVAGAIASAAIAFALREAWPHPRAAAALLGCGAMGYGLSLGLYLRAQRTLGAARTGSLFAFAPFVGAALAFALGDRSGGSFVALAAVLFGVAVYLHVTEGHHHRHRHVAIEHEHAHRHDDGHHTHTHAPPVLGAHSHPHLHDPTEHTHPHGSDLHHRHGHE